MKRDSFWFLITPLLVLAAGEIHSYYSRRHDQEGIHDSVTMQFVSALRGTQKKVVLPDGSTVWLNAASTLAYPADIANSDRGVELSGEAFFDVACKPSRPFRIRARDMLIEVLGTRFNVRNYPEEIHSQATVVSGKIRVRYHDQQAELQAGEGAELDPCQLNGKVFTTNKDNDTTMAGAWTKGNLRFTDIDLHTLLHDLSRAYNVDIELVGHVPARRIQGTASLTEPLEEVIERLILPYANVSISRPSPQRLIITVKG